MSEFEPDSASPGDAKEARMWATLLHLILSSLIYAVIFSILIVILIGIPLLWALALLFLIFPIIGAIKANDGEVWPYPLSIRFFGNG